MKGLIADIQRNSIHNGPGIRTTVFLKGCQLNCFWCHNPEMIKFYPEIQHQIFKCMGCGKCTETCTERARKIVDGKITILRELCKHCGKCVDVCPVGANRLIGKSMSADELLKIIILDKSFYKRSKGGVTFSGGEPMVQKKFLKEILKKCNKNNIQTALDTSGFSLWEDFEEILPYVDIYLYDIKLYDTKRHKNATCVSNENIKNNLEKLSNLNKEIIVRIPIIPTVNDSTEEINNILGFIYRLKNINLVELLNFHQLGSSKYESIGENYQAKDLKPLSRSKIERLGRLFLDKGLKTKIRF